MAPMVVEYVTPTTAPGSEGVLMVTPWPMVTEIVVWTERWLGLLTSVTVKVGVNELADEGVPEIAPEVPIVKPAGNPVADQE